MTDTKRTVIVHYHIYKNSGTSFDHVLRHSFGDLHETFDGPYPFFLVDQLQLGRVIRHRPQIVAFSSHQIMFPQPSSLDFRVLGAVFLRHPILRIGSIYRFKRQHADGTSTSEAAQRLDFGPWVDYCLRDRLEVGQISNAQTRYFAAPYGDIPLSAQRNGRMFYDLDTALRQLGGVEMLGRTESFERDVTRFARISAAHGLTMSLPDDLHRNVTEAAQGSIEDRVAALLDGMAPELVKRLMDANEQDLALYAEAGRLIAQSEASRLG
ncbi:MAG: sulfotransferase family 2 domain-containing protein [Paracoccus sp. (in: a-proteobacteria)]|nr:sulfotransferase family 2 domain-containing protein [Paracoccus sp. (in: a-proteobacteria)]